MTRIKRGVAAHQRHKKMLKAAKGYRGLRHSTFKQAKTAVMKAGVHSYMDRRKKKRSYRQLWVARINAACRGLGINYSRFIAKLTEKHVAIDRKMLAMMAVKNPESFKDIVDFAKN